MASYFCKDIVSGNISCFGNADNLQINGSEMYFIRFKNMKSRIERKANSEFG